MVPDLVHDRLGLLQGRARWEPGHHQHYPLVFIRNIGCGHAVEQITHGPHNQHKQEQVTQFFGQHLTDKPDIQIPGAKKSTVKPAEEGTQEPDCAIRWHVPLGHRFQKSGAEHRGQDQGHQD